MHIFVVPDRMCSSNRLVVSDGMSLVYITYTCSLWWNVLNIHWNISVALGGLQADPGKSKIDTPSPLVQTLGFLCRFLVDQLAL